MCRDGREVAVDSAVEGGESDGGERWLKELGEVGEDREVGAVSAEVEDDRAIVREPERWLGEAVEIGREPCAEPEPAQVRDADAHGIRLGVELQEEEILSVFVTRESKAFHRDDLREIEAKTMNFLLFERTWHPRRLHNRSRGDFDQATPFGHGDLRSNGA